MDAKITFQQLAKTLAQKKNLSQKEAETFLREFFDAIIQNVTIDKSVKIKGLGTFKLVEVLDRESVNINTGDRIIIPGHSKLSFTPDAALKDMVNKPFADFQTVVINEGTSLEDMEKMSALSIEPSSEEEEVSDAPPSEEEEVSDEPEEQEASSWEETDEAAEQEAVSELKEEPEPEDTMPSQQEESERADEPKLVLEGTDEEEDPNPFTPVKVRTMTTAEKWALTLGVILLCVASYLAGYHRVFAPLTEVQEKIEIKEAAPAQESLPPSSKPLREEAAGHSPSDVAEEGQRADSPQSMPDPNKKYQITGTRKVHTMKSGDYLTKIAVEEYGDKEFARYIIAHNNFRDPNNVPIGAEVKLPELKAEEQSEAEEKVK